MHAAQWETSLANYASPVFGGVAVADVDTDLVVQGAAADLEHQDRDRTQVARPDRVHPLIGPPSASTARARILQVARPSREPLANPNKIAPVTNFPALPWREIAAFMAQLREREGVAARAVQFAILTACRAGEVREVGMYRGNLARKTTLPAARESVGAASEDLT